MNRYMVKLNEKYVYQIVHTYATNLNQLIEMMDHLYGKDNIIEIKLIEDNKNKLRFDTSSRRFEYKTI